MKKLLSVALALVMVFSLNALTACNSSGDNGTQTVIRVINFNGGVGTKWMKEAQARYAETVKDVEFQPGKKGVYFDNTETMNLQSATMNTQGYHMYFDEAYSDIATLSQKGYLLDISDVVTQVNPYDSKIIEDKLVEDYAGAMKGNDGKYYALPHYEIYPGLSYDVELFDSENLYFAAPEETDIEPYSGEFGSANFIGSGTAKKSCGPDGVYETTDDGLPSSLEELIVLCDKMANVHTIQPITVAGMYLHYANYLFEGLWASLAGYDEMVSNFTFDKEIEVITDWTQANLFEGINYIKKPVTQKITVTEQTGYRNYDAAARYYAAAFIEILEHEKWMSEDSYSPNVSHIDAQSGVIFGGEDSNPRIGMLVEGSYWYNESVDAGNFDDYYAYTHKQNRNIAWMPLPVQLSGSVTEGHGRAPTLLDTGISAGFINVKVASDEGLTAACKDFMRFLYSDAELSHFTLACGSAKALDYDLLPEDEAAMSDYYKTVWDLRKGEKRVVYSNGNNPTFRASRDDLKIQTFVPVCKPFGNSSYLSAVRNGKSARECWENTRRSAQGWQSVYKG